MDEPDVARSPRDRVAGCAAARGLVDRRRPAVIGIDVGTSALKALLADADGPVRAVRRGYPLTVASDGRVELDADRVWHAARSAVRRLAAEAAERGLRIAAICAGGSGDEAVWLDDRDRVVAPVPMALDARSATDGRRLVEAVGADAFIAATGLPPSGAYPLPRLLWLRRTAPDLADRVRRLLAWPEFLALRLGVDPVAEPSLAARSAAFDIRRAAWSPVLLERAGVDPTIVPPVSATGSIVGTVPGSTAASLGLPPGVRIVAGGFDQAMATLGAGIVGSGIAHLGAGSWEALTVLRASASTELVGAGFSVGPAIAAGDRWAAMASWPGAVALGWIGRTGALGTGPRGRPAADVRRALAAAGTARDEPTEVLVLPDLDGRDAAGPGAAAIAGLRIDVDAPILARAVLEGIAFAAADQLDAVRAAGDPVVEVRITGGGTLDARWLQLRADVLGVPIVAIDPPDAGIAAAVALGWSGVVGDRSIDASMARLVRTRRPIEPRPAAAQRYEPMRARWRALRTAVRSMSAGPGARR